MLHLGWVPLALQTSNPPCRGLMNLLHVHKQRTTKQAGNTRFLELLIVPNMSINQHSLLKSTFFPLTRVISRPWEHINLQIAGVLCLCIGLHLQLPVSFHFAPAVWEHLPLYFLLRKVTWRTMSQASLVSEGSLCWVSAVIESGLLLPTEDGVSKLS